ncbi:hypothetical protein SAMN05421759_1103 [Roseivivax lentus]|uniref:Uncharacterized protein n=1 Tax=Roseivivax lentus TaxID=633194 RepID=A0A1N7NS43_9RHOB|nr:hypothetical protein [Roseivivax lentus]SIT01059.1 hypothetical protein SAMN05421759_1103 [Roseivivax lentus]
MPNAFRFFPNLRLGAVAEAEVADDGRLVARFEVDIASDRAGEDTSVPIDARFRGPGDVIGINPDEIARFEPPLGVTDFEPDYFPFVEFRAPDLPWRFALGDGDHDRPAPWLVLIALRDDEFQALGRGTAPCLRVQVHDAAASLPPLADRWAFAHVQLNSPQDEAAATQALRDDPDQAFARLLCPRKLAPLTRYSLFVVPAFETGRRAGLGLDPAPDDAGPAALAWDTGQGGPVTLPFYASSSFRTDEGLNLEALLEQLRSLDDTEADRLAEAEPFRLDHPGYFRRAFPKAGETDAEKALMPTGHRAGPSDAPEAMQAAMAAVLNQVIDGETGPTREEEALLARHLTGEDTAEDDADEDPLVAFPPYGFGYLDAPRLRTDVARWVEMVNLDPRFRVAAQLGAACIRDHQEELMQAAWRQYPEIVETNRLLHRLETAAVLVARTNARRFAKLPPDVGLVLAEPFTPYARRQDGMAAGAGIGFEAGTSVGGFLAESGAPPAYASRDLRRVGARVQTCNPAGAGLALRAPAIPGARDATAAGTVRKCSRLREVERHIAGRDRRIALDRLGQGGALRQTQETRLPARRSIAVRVTTFETAPLRDVLVQRLDALPGLKAAFRVTGRSQAEAEAGGILYRAPRLPVPLVEYMIAREPSALMAGVRDMPDNTVAFFEENRAFIEALMLGANHEMNGELRWRGFPTDMRGTPLTRFWNRGLPDHQAAHDDIGPITDWQKLLGQQSSPVNPNGNANLVVLIKGAVVRKLDEPILRIDISDEDGVWTPKPKRAPTLPSFSGKLSPTLAYYGFDIGLDFLTDPSRIDRAFFVIMEPAGRLRFGLDVGSLSVRRMRVLDRQGAGPGGLTAETRNPGRLEDWDELGFADLHRGPSDYIVSDQTLRKPAGSDLDLWGLERNSATIARSYWQKPVAAVVPFKGVFDGR